MRGAAGLVALLAACGGGTIENDPEIDQVRGGLTSLLRDPVAIKTNRCFHELAQGAVPAFARAQDTLEAPAQRPAGGEVVCATYDDRSRTAAIAPEACEGYPVAELQRLGLTAATMKACDPPDLGQALKDVDNWRIKKSEKAAWLGRVREATTKLKAWMDAPTTVTARAYWVDLCQTKVVGEYGGAGVGGVTDAIYQYKCYSRILWRAADGSVEAVAKGFGEASPEGVGWETNKSAIEAENKRTHVKALAAARANVAKVVP